MADIFCHPDYWDEAGNLFRSLSLPEAARYVAYADLACKQKIRVLLDVGFKQTSVLKKRVPGRLAKQSYLDVGVFEKASDDISGR